MSVPATLDNLFPKSVDIGNSGEKTYIYIYQHPFIMWDILKITSISEQQKKVVTPYCQGPRAQGLTKFILKRHGKTKKMTLGKIWNFAASVLESKLGVACLFGRTL